MSFLENFGSRGYRPLVDVSSLLDHPGALRGHSGHPGTCKGTSGAADAAPRGRTRRLLPEITFIFDENHDFSKIFENP